MSEMLWTNEQRLKTSSKYYKTITYQDTDLQNCHITSVHSLQNVLCLQHSVQRTGPGLGYIVRPYLKEQNQGS
jgi:hypothetical protein